MILWYCIPGHPLLNQNPGCHGITAETTQLLSHPTLEGCLGSGSPVPAQHLLHRAETWSVSHLWPREWDEHHGTLRRASTCPGLTDGSGQGGTTPTGHWCHICHTPATAGLSGELLGHTGVPWTVHGDSFPLVESQPPRTRTIPGLGPWWYPMARCL